MKRISKDNYYLEIAHVVSKRSTCLRKHYGAVVVNHDEIVLRIPPEIFVCWNLLILTILC